MQPGAQDRFPRADLPGADLRAEANVTEQERQRLLTLSGFERPFWQRGLLVAGVDEAGRGPLAGPVVAAAVVLPAEPLIAGIDDSKQLAPEVREELYERIVRQAIAVSIGRAEPWEIDRLNILRATCLAISRAIGGLPPICLHVFVDGLLVPGLPYPQTALVHGDARCYSVAAASIVAKVTRDRLMAQLDREYPGYGFARHKGYATPEHVRAIQSLGLCPLHRRSFRVPENLRGRYRCG
ncbi:MAG: ribonuclease HII [candidate division KSB1 bacterium]|nr:ribonuclease HII [candidate division KSB1 bacterium]